MPKATFAKTACCVNLSNGNEPDWFPADQLRIVDWQVVRPQLHHSFMKDMLAAAKKDPLENQTGILNYALDQLGIQDLTGNQNKQFLKVGYPCSITQLSLIDLELRGESRTIIS